PHIERLKMETSELTRNKLPLRLVARDLPRSATHLHITQFALVSDQRLFATSQLLDFNQAVSLRPGQSSSREK
ncbi:MAG TPA: hypothetical protein VJ848_00225, partial [Candidatus Angelobacter sp.]|nr:hypothetical protein [Candidatus Angelobacter sp.]